MYLWDSYSISVLKERGGRILIKLTIRIAALFGLMSVLGGCGIIPVFNGGSYEKLVTDEINKTPSQVMKTCLASADQYIQKGLEKQVNNLIQTANKPASDPDLSAPVIVKKKVYNHFLDCAFGIDISEGVPSTEFRLIRAHAALSLLATYGGYSLAFDPKRQQQDAEKLFITIVEAENSLWKASHLSNSRSTRTPEVIALTAPLEQQRLIRSVANVAQASLAPLKNRAVGFGKKFIRALTPPSPVPAINLLHSIRGAVKRAAVIEIKGAKYIEGVRDLLKITIQKKPQSKQLIADWEAVDTQFLNKACNKIAFYAFGEYRSCIPEQRRTSP